MRLPFEEPKLKLLQIIPKSKDGVLVTHMEGRMEKFEMKRKEEE